MGNREDLNAQHRQSPKVGDYWNEMFTPIMVVVGVSDSAVTICCKVVDADGHWTWDLAKCERLTMAEFARKPLYGSPSMGDKCWCDVRPEAHKWVREAAISAMFGAST